MTSTLLSLCLINTLWNKYRKTYVDNFVPLVASILVKYNYQHFDIHKIDEISEYFSKDFSIHIPTNPLLSILTKCKKLKILRVTGKTYHLNETIAKQYDISKDIESNLCKQKMLIDDFIQYFFNEQQEAITQDLAENLVLSFIENNDVNLFFASNQSANKLIPEPKLPHGYKRYKYIFSKYVSELSLNKPDIFKILIEIALGSIATNALLFTFSSNTAESIKNCDIYLDTSLILRLIGADEKNSRESVKCFLQSIRNSGGNIKIFTHIYDEAKEALNSALEYCDSINFDPAKANRTTLYFRQEGYSRSDVELVIASFDRILEENSILKENVPEYTFENTNIDERELQRIFESELLKNDPTFQKDFYRRRTLRDISSVSSISRLRTTNRYIRNIKDAKYIFVTSNGALSYSNYLYNKKFNREDSKKIPESVSDIFLETYLWVNTPQILGIVHSFKIKAVALSTIRPNLEMEQALYIEAKKLLERNQITQDDYLLLTNSHLVLDMLSDKHFGDISQIKEGTIADMLEEVKSRLLGNKNKEITELTEKYIEEQTKRKEAEEKALELESEKSKLVIPLIRKAAKTAEMKKKSLKIVLSSIYGISIIAPIVSAIFINIVLVSILAIPTGITIYFSAKGYSIDSFCSKYYEKFLTKEKRTLGIEDYK
jgi:hypothetical protein